MCQIMQSWRSHFTGDQKYKFTSSDCFGTRICFLLWRIMQACLWTFKGIVRTDNSVTNSESFLDISFKLYIENIRFNFHSTLKSILYYINYVVVTLEVLVEIFSLTNFVLIGVIVTHKNVNLQFCSVVWTFDNCSIWVIHTFYYIRKLAASHAMFDVFDTRLLNDGVTFKYQE